MGKKSFFSAYPCQQVSTKRHAPDEAENKNSDRNPFGRVPLYHRPSYTIVRIRRPVYPIGGDSPPLFRLPSSGIRIGNDRSGNMDRRRAGRKLFVAMLFIPENYIIYYYIILLCARPSCVYTSSSSHTLVPDRSHRIRMDACDEIASRRNLVRHLYYYIARSIYITTYRDRK